MGFLRKRLLRRFSVLGRVIDMALVTGAVLRFAQRRGWISEDLSASLGLNLLTRSSNKGSGSSAPTMALGEIALAAGAAWRLLRHKR